MARAGQEGASDAHLTGLDPDFLQAVDRPSGPRPLPLFLARVAELAVRDPERARAVLAGLARLQTMPRAPHMRPGRIVARAGRARLIDFAPRGRGEGQGEPIVLIPSLINPASIFDLTPDRSFIGWCLGQGYRPLLIDWGAAGAEDPDLAGHAELAATLIAGLGAPVPVVGYCLGGTLALAVGQLVPLAALATIAAPWFFSGYGEASRARCAAMWEGTNRVTGTLGVMPMEVLQNGFWQLDVEGLMAKYARFSAMEAPEDIAMFVATEDWVNAGEPLPRDAARELFEDFFERDLPGRGEWRVAGQRIRPEGLTCPLFDIASTHDRIVPMASALASSSAVFSPEAPAGRNCLELALGHVGMMIGGRAESLLWRPLAEWIKAQRT